MAINPYPGLRPFRPEETRLFMGREISSSVIITRVRVSPLTVMFARSGVGKSSFLICRLIPILLKDSAVLYTNEWGSQRPEEILLAQVTSLRHEAPNEEIPVLILDQFEDVFKFPYERRALWDLMSEVITDERDPIHILVSMREEWLGAMEEMSNYITDSATSMVRLSPLSDKEIRQAIKRPAEVEGTVTVTDALADHLVLDLKQPSAFGMGDGYVEPGLLQLVCSRLWQAASSSAEKVMNEELYRVLGGADTIIRGFVWNTLGKAGTPSSSFSASDRVMWAGLTRHLIIAQGIKAILNPKALAKKLRLEDLGFAGPAIVVMIRSSEPMSPLKYLEKIPERRGDPPVALVSALSELLKKGVEIGFLKKQRGPLLGGDVDDSRLYELSHDFLGPMFQQFSVEFESWIRTKIAKVIGGLIGLVVALPGLGLAYFVIGAEVKSILAFLFQLALFVVFYIGGAYVFKYIGVFLKRIMGYPIVRALAKGEVPLPDARRVSLNGNKQSRNGNA